MFRINLNLNIQMPGPWAAGLLFPTDRNPTTINVKTVTVRLNVNRHCQTEFERSATPMTEFPLQPIKEFETEVSGHIAICKRFDSCDSEAS